MRLADVPLTSFAHGPPRSTPDMPGIAHHLRVYRVLIADRDAPQVHAPQGPTETTGGKPMKVVRSLKKKITDEKSLKSYAWYIWY